MANFNRITRDAVTVAEALEKAQTVGHLVSPATSCGSLPEGTSVALSAVLVDVARETYGIAGGGDKVGLGKVALDRIALAAGVSWDPQQSRRTDDGRDPHYVSYVAVGHYRQFDGSTCTIIGEKELDMREKSPAVEALRAKYREKLAVWEQDGKQGYPPRSPDLQIAEVRTHLLSHAASKAKLRAIRGLGIRTSYSKAELAKPFVIAKLTFSGESEDPELRRAFALMRARSFLGAHAALYGRAPSAPQLPPGRPAPPVGQTLDAFRPRRRRLLRTPLRRASRSLVGRTAGSPSSSRTIAISLFGRAGSPRISRPGTSSRRSERRTRRSSLPFAPSRVAASARTRAARSKVRPRGALTTTFLSEVSNAEVQDVHG
jgi:hypothetical protein